MGPIEEFDHRLLEVLRALLRTPAIPENVWLQTSLPTRYGGLGVAHSKEISRAAFIGSSIQTSALTAALLKRPLAGFVPDDALELLIQHNHETLATHSAMDLQHVPHLQKFLSADVWRSLRRRLLQGSSLRDKARLQAVGMSHAGAFILARPIPFLNQRVDDSKLFRLMLRRYLGIPLLDRPGLCRTCLSPFDIHGDHAMVCRTGRDKTIRHDGLRNILLGVARSAAMIARPEPPDRVLPDGRRPGDLTIEGYEPGKISTCFDVTIREPLQLTHLPHAALQAGYVARLAHRDKLNRYAEGCAAAGYGFVPLVWETFGGATEEVHEILRHWIRAIYDRSGGAQGEGSLSFLFSSVYQRISLHIQRCNGYMVSSRVPLPQGLQEDDQFLQQEEDVAGLR